MTSKKPLWILNVENDVFIKYYWDKTGWYIKDIFFVLKSFVLLLTYLIDYFNIWIQKIPVSVGHWLQSKGDEDSDGDGVNCHNFRGTYHVSGGWWDNLCTLFSSPTWGGIGCYALSRKLVFGGTISLWAH